jgi:hypothetical protein
MFIKNKMKKSKIIELIFVAGIVAACSNNKEPQSKMHIRGDSTSSYTTNRGFGYYHLIPFGFMYGMNRYSHGGYESNQFSSKASPRISRGGFGGSTRVGG